MRLQGRKIIGKKVYRKTKRKSAKNGNLVLYLAGEIPVPLFFNGHIPLKKKGTESLFFFNSRKIRMVDFPLLK